LSGIDKSKVALIHASESAKARDEAARRDGQVRLSYKHAAC
jgi:hypothetical protein